MKKIGVILIIVAVFGVGIFFALGGNDKNSSNNSQTLATETSTNTSTNNSDSTTTFTKEEVAKHSTSSDCWTIIDGGVYNLTSFVSQHPGGAREISRVCGIDGTSLFNGNRQHTGEADAQLAKLKIGTLN